MFKLFRKNRDNKDDRDDEAVIPLSKKIVDMGGRIMPKIKAEIVEEEPEEKAPKVNAGVYGRAINFVLLALVFLLPILFLPTSSEVREFNKQALLFVAVVVMLGIWVVKVLATRSVSFVKTSLDYIVLALLATSLVSSIFSLDKASSFLGYYGRFTGSFLSVLSLVVLYFLVVNNLRSKRIADKLIKYLTLSFAVVLVYSFLQMLGLYILPFAWVQNKSFNPVGSLVSLGILAALAVLLVLWSWMKDKNISKNKNIALTALLVLGLLTMFLINAFIAWLVLALGVIVFLAVGMALTAHENDTAWFWKPMIVLVISILFVAFNFLPQSINPRKVVNIDLPIEVQLSNATTMNLVKNALGSGVKQAVIGFGPGATGLAFGDIKPEALNKTIVWNLNFDRASSEAANIIIENGILGFLAFELTALLFLIYALYFLFKKADHPGRMQAFGFFVLWLTLYAAHFLYFFNTTLYFLFWLNLAAFMAVTHWPAFAEASAGTPRSSSSHNSLGSEGGWQTRADHRWVLTFGFGLVHGFGFANVLRELGLPTRGLVSSLLAFNVGVELGQLAAVSLLFPVILRLAKRASYRRVVVVASCVILAFGLGWLVERAFGFSFMPF